MRKNKVVQSIKNIFKKIFKTKKRIIIFMIILLVVIFGIYKFCRLLKDTSSTFLVEKGEICQDETIQGYILRNESIVEGNNSGNKLIQIKNEGEKVGKNEAIFRYAANDEDELNAKMQELDIKIQDALKKENTVFSSDIKLLDNQIENSLENIYEINSLQKVNEYKKNINSYITKKTQIAGGLSKGGTNLKDLINQRAVYEKQLSDSSEYIYATRSGTVSYRVDGLEEVLKTGDYNYLSTEFLDSLNLKTSQIIPNDSEKGKIIDNFKCCIACTMNSNEASKAKVGDVIKLRLPNSSEISTTIVFIRDEENGNRMFVFEIENEVQELVKYRKIVFDIIWWSDVGLRVPVSAIDEENGLTYVTRNKAGYEEKVFVKVKRKNNKYAIVDNYSNEELISLGYDLNNLSGKKSISLYDEIKVKATGK